MRAAVLALALCACVSGSRRWTALDVGSELALGAVTMVDWRQTVDITRNCGEANPVLGACGKRFPLAAWVPLVLAAHFGVAAALPHGEVRSLWQWTALGAEAATVWTNWRSGYWPSRQAVADQTTYGVVAEPRVGGGLFPWRASAAPW